MITPKSNTNNNYYRVCSFLKDHGVLVETDKNILDYVKQGKPLYRSVYTYEQRHKDKFVSQGNSVKGIDDVKTNFVFLDFDSYQPDLEDARQAALDAVERLNDLGVQNNEIDICFSGSKGISITFTIDLYLTTEEYKNFHRKLIGDLGTNYDSTVVSANRIYRVPFTKHEVSGLYKHPISFEMLRDKTMAEIKELAKADPVETVYEELTENEVHFNDEMMAMTKPAPTIVRALANIDVGSLDFKAKMKGLTNCRWAILNGFAPKGTAHNLNMALAASLKVAAIPKEIAEQMIVGANNMRSARLGEPPQDPEEVRRQIINSVYDPAWKGGQYTCRTDGALRDFCQSLGSHKCNHTQEEENIQSLDSVMGSFREYAKNFDQNILKSGIYDLDLHCKFMAGTSSHILGAPGSGKCLAKGTKVRMFDGSLKNVEDVMVGEQLMGDDGTARNVLSVCKGREEMFEVKQERGKSYTVNKSHILSVVDLNPARPGHLMDMGVTDWMAKSPTRQKELAGYRVATEYPEVATEINPYILGLFLGGDDMAVYEKLLERDTLITSLKSVLGEELNKKIPSKYLINSRENRLRLLAGLLDGGKGTKASREINIDIEQEELNKNIAELVWSLGYWYKEKVSKFGLRTMKIDAWNWKEIPTAREKKVCFKSVRSVTRSKLTVTSVGEGDYYGFEIDGNRRFLLEDYTVTHNTSVTLQILEHNSSKGNPCMFFCLDMNKFNLIASIARRYFNFDAKEVQVTRDGEKVECPDLEEIIMTHYKLNTPKSYEIDRLILEKYKNVKFVFKPSYHINHMQAAVAEAAEYFGKPVKLVMIDYSELVNTDQTDPTQSSAIVAQQCRHMAIETQAAFITLVQPNKNNSDVREELSSYTGAKGSGAIAQSSQLMLSVSRPGFSPKEPENDKYMVINAVKNRSGPLFSVDMGWAGKNGTNFTLSEEERKDLKMLRDRLRSEKDASSGGGNRGKTEIL